MGHLEDQELSSIALRYGTPIYVTELSIIEENYKRIYQAFNRHFPTKVLYAVKANYNPAILARLRSLGSWFDASSPFEIGFALRAGAEPFTISFAPANAGLEELIYAVKSGVNVVVADSLGMLKQLGTIAKFRTALRLNPGISAGHSEKVMTGEKGSKFGIYPESIREALDFSSMNLELVGLHSHIGSGIKTPEPYLQLIYFLKDLTSSSSLELEFIDIGGGFDFEDPNGFDVVGQAFEKAFGNEVDQLRVEPGRYLVKGSSVLLTTVNQVKDAVGKRFAQVDAGMNALLRPMLYGAVHPMRKLGSDSEKTYLYDVVGPICENTDILARDVSLPSLRTGDVIAIEQVGAYGYSMSSNYNLRPRPAELVLNRGTVVLYKPKESLDDLFRPYAQAGFSP
jgi:diaminopimelate decarboxylase